MRRIRKVTLEELVAENKQTLLQDKKEMEKIDRRIEEKRMKKV